MKLWSQILGKMAVLVQEIRLKKVQKSKSKKNEIFFSKSFVGHIRPFVHKSETTVSKHFFSQLLLFSIQSSKMSKNIRKLRVKLSTIEILIGVYKAAPGFARIC